MNYKQCFIAVYGNSEIGPFEDMTQCCSEAKNLFKTNDFVVLIWYIPADERAPEIVEDVNEP